MAALPSAKTLALGKVPAQGGATWPLCRVPEIRYSAKIDLPWEALPSVTLGKEFAEYKLAFAECNRHSAKPVNPVVI